MPDDSRYQGSGAAGMFLEDMLGLSCRIEWIFLTVRLGVKVVQQSDSIDNAVPQGSKGTGTRDANHG